MTALFITLLAGHVENLRKNRSEIRALNDALELKLEERTRQLLEAQEELAHKGKLAMLGVIAGGMGNELRNPLGLMSNAVFFLQSAVPDADETVREYLGIIRDEIDHSLQIISDLLDFYRDITPRIEPVPVHELVEHGLKGCAMPEKVQFRIDIGDPPAILADPKQMEQVLRSLITNAVQAMPDGGALPISVRQPRAGLWSPREPAGQGAAAPLGETGDFVEISIADTGEGIAPEHMERLFQPLFQH